MMPPQRLPRDWLVRVLVERCKEGTIVDRRDLAFILYLNLDQHTMRDEFSPFYVLGEAILALGIAVVAKSGELVVPDLTNYNQSIVLKAPDEWLDEWRDPAARPTTFNLAVSFDMYSAQYPDGRPYVIDGPGAHTLENSRGYREHQRDTLEKRRLHRLATRSGVSTLPPVLDQLDDDPDVLEEDRILREMIEELSARGHIAD